MAKKALISGYIGFGNFGDDVVFSLLTRHLKAKGFEVEALSSNPSLTAKQFKVRSYDYKNPAQILKAMGKTQYLISGGGSLLQNVTSNYSLIYYVLIILLAKLMGKKVIVFGQGIGPVRGIFWNFLTRLAFICADLITVRDTHASEILKKWKIKHHLLCDVAWDIPIVQLEKPTYVGIQLRSFPLMHTQFITEFAKYVGNYFSEKKIVILPLQYSQDLEISYKFERELKHQFPLINAEVKPIDNLNELISEFSNFDFLLAMRYHACLLGLKYGSKVLALPYDIKVKDLAKEFELQMIEVVKEPQDYNEIFRKFVHYADHQDIIQKRKRRFDWRPIDEFMTK